jgi:hypothetical protein
MDAVVLCAKAPHGAARRISAMTDTAKPVVKTAEELRMMIIEQQMSKLDSGSEARRREEEARAAFVDDFMNGEITEAEQSAIRNLVMNAVKAGQLEALIYSFPSSLCTDGGRAINNAEADWPSTLTGKARQLLDKYEEKARPAGYQLKAQIINFPGGIPGDVGLFLAWG